MSDLVIVGYYGADNFGDELMLEGILTNVPEKTSVTVLNFGANTDQNFFNDFKIQIHSKSIRGDTYLRKFQSLIVLFKAILKAKVVIFGGGTIFFDNVNAGFRILFGPLKVSIISFLVRTPYILYSCAIGELNTKIGNVISYIILKGAERVYLRSQITTASFIPYSERIAHKLYYVNDPAVMADFHSDGLYKSCAKNIVISLMESDYREIGLFDEDKMIELLLVYVKREVRKGQSIFLLPMQEGIFRNDSLVCDKLLSKATPELRKNIYPLYRKSYREKKKILQLAGSIISMRYHPLVVANILKIKAFSLSITDKSYYFALDNFGEDSVVAMRKQHWELELKSKLKKFSVSPSRLSIVDHRYDAQMQKNQFRKILQGLLFSD